MQNYAADKYTELTGEGFITVWPWNYSAIIAGTWAWGDNTNQMYDGAWYDSSTADQDQIDYIVSLAAGTYTFSVLTITSNAYGIMDVLIDGASVGTIDLYTLAAAYNVIKTITGIVVATSGLKTISILANGKNGSSSDYTLTYNNFVLFRTA